MNFGYAPYYGTSAREFDRMVLELLVRAERGGRFPTFHPVSPHPPTSDSDVVTTCPSDVVTTCPPPLPEPLIISVPPEVIRPPEPTAPSFVPCVSTEVEAASIQVEKQEVERRYFRPHRAEWVHPAKQFSEDSFDRQMVYYEVFGVPYEFGRFDDDGPE